MAKAVVSELASDFIAEVDKARYYFRVIESAPKPKLNETESKKRKFFGVSKFWFNAGINKWVPAQKNHIYLPAELWAPFQDSVARVQHRMISDANGHSVPISDGSGHQLATSSENSDTAGEPANITAAIVTDVDTTAELAIKRKRGRPPKCRQPIETARNGRHDCINTEESDADTGETKQGSKCNAVAAEAQASNEASAGDSNGNQEFTSATAV